ncbi:miniconductance mechanosensitive channel [Vallitalea longa]|uniref:Miniconductance mechanosensitive channel n=1 Tax=Vallitalea longa TaxID=2936439 RepID=A0A9W6DEI5_9FIRM|nr:mechanosensitive ion channel domain-containing protein [Vallitalea longa]GKX29550.1 miniconductance mechanosensitive channel [Vallitalea longa]
MVTGIEKWLSKFDINNTWLSIVIAILIIVLICFVIQKITKYVILNIIQKIVYKTDNVFDEILYENKVFHNISHIGPALVIYIFSNSFKYSELIQEFVYAYILLILTLTFFRILDAIQQIYRTREFAKSRPIKGIMQVIKIFIIIFSVMFLIAIFTDSSVAWAMLSGVGGMSAIIILIFRDSILGLVAGIQLSTNNLLKIGDWIEMNQFGADGEVIDISLTNITVENWDKTLVNIPAYKFIDESFKNWQGMIDAGGRRIKRAVNINIDSIKFLDDKLYNELLEIDMLRDYLVDKQKDIVTYNKKCNMRNEMNGRRLTNVGTFRAYILEYLKRNPNIHNDFTLLVRQLAPTYKGLPIEIYCFTNNTAWADYEGIMADIFDHIFAIVNYFDLEIYQSPSNYDFQQIANDK